MDTIKLINALTGIVGVAADLGNEYIQETANELIDYIREYKTNYHGPIVFTTGAYLQPVKLLSGNWVWVVTEFDNDSFKDGEVFNPVEYAETLDNLLKAE